jgi:hypothetical protein
MLAEGGRLSSPEVDANVGHVAEPPELLQLKCLSPALEARPHLRACLVSSQSMWIEWD